MEYIGAVLVNTATSVRCDRWKNHPLSSNLLPKPDVIMRSWGFKRTFIMVQPALWSPWKIYALSQIQRMSFTVVIYHGFLIFAMSICLPPGWHDFRPLTLLAFCQQIVESTEYWTPRELAIMKFAVDVSSEYHRMSVKAVYYRALFQTTLQPQRKDLKRPHISLSHVRAMVYLLYI